MKKKALFIRKLDEQLSPLFTIKTVNRPAEGWIRMIRTTLGMHAQQLANTLCMTRQGVNDLEERERDGSITLRSLQQAAHAMDMELVYAILPREGSIEELINKRAEVLASQIVLRAAQLMRIEEHVTDQQQVEKAIAEYKNFILEDMPKALWDRKHETAHQL